MLEIFLSESVKNTLNNSDSPYLVLELETFCVVIIGVQLWLNPLGIPKDISEKNVITMKDVPNRWFFVVEKTSPRKLINLMDSVLDDYVYFCDTLLKEGNIYVA